MCMSLEAIEQPVAASHVEITFQPSEAQERHLAASYLHHVSPLQWGMRSISLALLSLSLPNPPSDRRSLLRLQIHLAPLP